MKSFKRFEINFYAFLLCFSVVAISCSKSDDDDEKDNETSNTETSETKSGYRVSTIVETTSSIKGNYSKKYSFKYSSGTSISIYNTPSKSYLFKKPEPNYLAIYDANTNDHLKTCRLNSSGYVESEQSSVLLSSEIQESASFAYNSNGFLSKLKYDVLKSPYQSATYSGEASFDYGNGNKSVKVNSTTKVTGLPTNTKIWNYSFGNEKNNSNIDLNCYINYAMKNIQYNLAPLAPFGFYGKKLEYLITAEEYFYGSIYTIDNNYVITRNNDDLVSKIVWGDNIQTNQIEIYYEKY